MLGRNLFPSFPGASCTLQAGSFQPQEEAGEGLHLPAPLFHRGELYLSGLRRPLLCPLGLCGSSCLLVPRPVGRLHHQTELPSSEGGNKHMSLQKASPTPSFPFIMKIPLHFLLSAISQQRQLAAPWVTFSFPMMPVTADLQRKPQHPRPLWLSPPPQPWHLEMLQASVPSEMGSG